MKKLVLVVGILVTGFVSAKNTTIENKAIKGACVTYTSECGVIAQTCNTEGLSLMDLIDWANRIEANYCAPNAPYSNTPGL